MLKKAFTLFELIIVIILVGIVYYLTLSNFTLKQQKLDAITLTNLKQTLQSMEFTKNIIIKCIDDESVECLVVIDDEVQDEKITGLFKNCPDVYEYSREQEKIEFMDVELEKLETLPICFEFELNKNGHSSQIIVDTAEDVYIYDNISNKPHKIKYLNDIGLYFDDKNSEVKDAF